MDEQQLNAAHQHSACHFDEVLASERCGCFYCCGKFAPERINRWVQWGDEQKTAICPRCGIDSVIGSASGFAITDDFLAKMNMRWFLD